MYFKVVIRLGSLVLTAAVALQCQVSRSRFRDVGLLCLSRSPQVSVVSSSLVSAPFPFSPFVSTSHPIGVRSSTNQQNHSRLPDNLPCSCIGLDLCPLDPFLRSQSSPQNALVTPKGLLGHSLDRLHRTILPCGCAPLLPPLRWCVCCEREGRAFRCCPMKVLLGMP